MSVEDLSITRVDGAGVLMELPASVEISRFAIRDNLGPAIQIIGEANAHLRLHEGVLSGNMGGILLGDSRDALDERDLLDRVQILDDPAIARAN